MGCPWEVGIVRRIRFLFTSHSGELPTPILLRSFSLWQEPLARFLRGSGHFSSLEGYILHPVDADQSWASSSMVRLEGPLKGSTALLGKSI